MGQRNPISLRGARQRAGLSRKEVARRTGVTVDQLLCWEKNPGSVPPLWALVLSRIYRISIDRIRFDDSDHTD